MPFFAQTREFNQQPQYAAGVDWSNPLVIAAKIKYVVVTGGCGLRTTTIFQKSKALILPTRCGLITPIGISSVYTGADANELTGTAGFANNSRSMFALIHGGITGSSYDYCRLTQASGGKIEYNHGNITFSVRTYNGTFTTPAVSHTGRLSVWGTWDQPNNIGTLYVPGNTPTTVATTSTWDLNNNLVGVFNGADQASLLLGFYCEGVVPKSLRDALSSNPWQIFSAPASRIWLPSAGGGILAANASGTDTASGSASLAAQVALAGIGVSIAGGSANAGFSIPLSAAGISITGGSANGRVAVTISAAGLAQAAGQAGLSAAVLMQAAGAAQAAGNATLATQLNALASGAAQAGGSANLSGGAPGALSATGGDTASGSAVLSVTVQLQATGSDTASGSANLTGGAPGQISASGGAQAGGSATVKVTVNLTATGFIQAMGAGQLTLQIDGELLQPGPSCYRVVASRRIRNVQASARLNRVFATKRNYRVSHAIN